MRVSVKKWSRRPDAVAVVITVDAFDQEAIKKRSRISRAAHGLHVAGIRSRVRPLRPSKETIVWRPQARRRAIQLAVVVTVAATLGVAGCGGDQDNGMAGNAGHGSSTVASRQGTADVAFVQGMIPHHQQAVTMAELALASNAQAGQAVKDLAARIKRAQDPEIGLMRGWLAKWGESEAPGGHQMSGMATEQDLASLVQVTGDRFDQMWLTMMIAHHEGAIEMAQSVKATGSDVETKQLADRIISAQRDEITQMNDLLAG